MVLKHGRGIASSELTPYRTYLRRRDFLRSGALGAAGVLSGALGLLPDAAAAAETLNIRKKSATTTDTPTSLDAITTYNNFYEFGSAKDDPAKNSKMFKPRPWSVAV